MIKTILFSVLFLSCGEAFAQEDRSTAERVWLGDGQRQDYRVSAGLECDAGYWRKYPLTYTRRSKCYLYMGSNRLRRFSVAVGVGCPAGYERLNYPSIERTGRCDDHSRYQINPDASCPDGYIREMRIGASPSGAAGHRHCTILDPVFGYDVLRLDENVSCPSGFRSAVARGNIDGRHRRCVRLPVEAPASAEDEPNSGSIDE